VKKFEGKPFALLGVFSGGNRGQAAKIIESDPIRWRSWCDGGTEGPISETCNIRRRPTTFVLDAKGVIRSKDLRGQQLEEAVEKLLRETTSKP